jgi:hypothetical protein
MPITPPSSRPRREEAREAWWASTARGSSRHSTTPATWAGTIARIASTVQRAPAECSVVQTITPTLPMITPSTVNRVGRLIAEAASSPGCSSFAVRGYSASRRGSRVSSRPKANRGSSSQTRASAVPRARTAVANSAPSESTATVVTTRATRVAIPPSP